MKLITCIVFPELKWSIQNCLSQASWQEPESKGNGWRNFCLWVSHTKRPIFNWKACQTNYFDSKTNFHFSPFLGSFNRICIWKAMMESLKKHHKVFRKLAEQKLSLALYFIHSRTATFLKWTTQPNMSRSYIPGWKTLPFRRRRSRTSMLWKMIKKQRLRWGQFLPSIPFSANQDTHRTSQAAIEDIENASSTVKGWRGRCLASQGTYSVHVKKLWHMNPSC